MRGEEGWLQGRLWPPVRVKIAFSDSRLLPFFAWFEINWLLVVAFADERFQEAFRILLARRRRARPNAADFVCARRLRGSTE